MGFVGEALAGCAAVRPPAGESRTVTVIVRILGPYRRRGLGAAYLEFAMAEVRALRPDRVEPVVLESNADGLEFALRHGFGELDRYLVDGQTVPFVDLHLEE